MPIAMLLFWFSLVWLFYIYVGYPLLVLVLSWLRPRPVHTAATVPRVTIIIPAFNEAACIRSTLENKLALDYPADHLELLVVSDASTDDTEAIVQEYAGPRVHLIRQDQRQGKTAALNRAVQVATGEILVFSDANSLYASNALRFLMENFADPSVGYVTGRMVYRATSFSGTAQGCMRYMDYEHLVRLAETRLGSVVGVNGGIDAIRKSLYIAMRPDQLPDFVSPLHVVSAGFRVVYECRAELSEAALSRPADEYRMRVRVSLRTLCALRDMKHLFDPQRYGAFAWQLTSHKLLRYLAFIPGFILLAANAALFASHPGYTLIFFLQAAFYLAAVCGWALDSRGVSVLPLRLAFYFCLVNVAALQAFLSFLGGKRQVVWAPRTG